MPSLLGHAAVAISLGSALRPSALPARFWIVLGVAAALPDLDAFGRPFGSTDFEHLVGGHRGLTHSIPFAMTLAAALVQPQIVGSDWVGSRLRLWIVACVAIASHGLIDTFTVYGEGVALFAPFSWHQVKATWTPLGMSGPCQGAVDCITGLVRNEFLWLGLPSLALFGLSIVISRLRSRSEPA